VKAQSLPRLRTLTNDYERETDALSAQTALARAAEARQRLASFQAAPSSCLRAGTSAEAELSAEFAKSVARRRTQREVLAGAFGSLAPALSPAGASARPRRPVAADQSVDWSRGPASSNEASPASLPSLVGHATSGTAGGGADARRGHMVKPFRSRSLAPGRGWPAARALDAARRAFAVADARRKGWLTADEMRWAAAVVLGSGQRSAVEAMLSTCPGERAFEPEFLRFVAGQIAASDPFVRAKRMFQTYDENGDGYLDLREAQRCFQNLVPDYSEAVVRGMFMAMDENGDGVLSVEEFVKFVTPWMEDRRALPLAADLVGPPDQYGGALSPREPDLLAPRHGKPAP